MTDKIKDALAYLERVPFPEMELGADGTIWTEGGLKVATMNLRDLTLPQAFAFASAFIAAGEALAEHEAATDTTWHERRTMLPDGDARKEGGK